MYDRTSNTLWHSLTGEPVIGKLANNGLKLKLLPITVSSWEEWLTAYPETTVLSTDTGFRRNYLNPNDPHAVYNDYFTSPDLMFPSFERNDTLPEKATVLALRFGNAAKAYPISILAVELVVNDLVGEQEVVVIGHPTSGAARAFDRGGHTFTPGSAPSEVVDESGGVWVIDEEAGLIRDGNASTALAGLPGHQAFWFGRVVFYPKTELYTGR